jgi:hypothetical protein
MPPKATDTDSTACLAHIKCMLNHLAAQQEQEAPDEPTDIMTELGVLADAFMGLAKLDAKARQRVLDWLHQRFDTNNDAPRF